ncbi:MAG: ribonuclease HI [Cyclobacteriaceae bacterium]|jgi:ribonuclease HI
MDKLLLFVDGSVDPALKIGFGAFLVNDENESSIESNSKQVKVRRFDNTSSTKLELQTLIWALNEHQGVNRKIVVFTDSQNIIGLPGRRKRLEQNDYHSGQNDRLKNHGLYRAFYQLLDQYHFELVKVVGHQSSMHKNDIDRLFTRVDKVARKALKAYKTTMGL